MNGRLPTGNPGTYATGSPSRQRWTAVNEAYVAGSLGYASLEELASANGFSSPEELAESYGHSCIEDFFTSPGFARRMETVRRRTP